MQSTLRRSQSAITGGGLLFYIFLLILFGGLAVFSGYQVQQQSELDRSGVQVPGIVLKREVVQLDEIEYHLIYLFAGHEGRQRVTEDFYNNYAEMDTINVTYLPDSPEINRVQDDNVARLWYIVITIVSTLLFLTVLYASLPRTRITHRLWALFGPRDATG